MLFYNEPIAGKALRFRKNKLTYIVVFLNVLDSIKFQGTKEITES